MVTLNVYGELMEPVWSRSHTSATHWIEAHVELDTQVEYNVSN